MLIKIENNLICLFLLFCFTTYFCCMFSWYDEIYWYKKYTNETSYEMMVTYVYVIGGHVQSNININQLKTLLNTSQEFRHFVIAICNDFCKFNKYNYDFMFSQIDSKTILTLIRTDNSYIKNLFFDGSFDSKHDYLTNLKKQKHLIE